MNKTRCLIGPHASIGKGVLNAIKYVEYIDGNTIQIFLGGTKSASLKMKTKLTALAVAISAQLIPFGNIAIAQEESAEKDQEVELIMVTGSFVRRSENFESPSPLAVLDAGDIDSIGAKSIADITQTLISPLASVLCLPIVNNAEPATTSVACTKWSAFHCFVTPSASNLNVLTVAYPPK